MNESFLCNVGTRMVCYTSISLLKRIFSQETILFHFKTMIHDERLLNRRHKQINAYCCAVFEKDCALETPNTSSDGDFDGKGNGIVAVGHTDCGYWSRLLTLRDKSYRSNTQ